MLVTEVISPTYLGGQPTLFQDSPFLEIQDVPTFFRPIRKTKVLDESFSRLLYKFYPQSI